MKSKKNICLLLVFLLMVLSINIKSYAVTQPELMITSNNYAAGDKMRYDNVKDVEVEETLQLYAVIAHGNDILIGNNADSLGWFVDEANLSGATWTSSNNNIATVDNSGKVTGVSEGKTNITVNYNNESSTYEVNVKTKSKKEHTGINFVRSEPEHAKILNKEYGFLLYLYNIPDTEKGNIKVAIENEKIAKLTGIDLCNWEDGSGKGMIMAKAKLLALGQTKITATLNYNGKTYSDTYNFDVVESMYSLSLSAKENTDLPSSLDVGDKIQLTVMLNTYGGSLLPEDVTAKGVTYTSSNEKVVIVDDKGLVTAIGEGDAIITVKYKVGEETITVTYNLKIIDSTKSPVSGEHINPSSSDSPTTKSNQTSAPTKLPKTGENVTLIIMGIILIFSISVIMYKKYKNY